jgi:DNA-binding response OmpR family regulator
MSADVLVVEDAPDIRGLIVHHLERDGFRCRTAGTGPDALAAVRAALPALVVLDVMLPGMDGLEVCRRLRADSTAAAVPIIMLTAKADEVDRVVGLELGADDYVTKPFSPRELAARVRTVLRRSTPDVGKAERLSFDELDLDARTREVTCRGEALRLTAREFDLLWFLASHPKQVFSRDQLMDRVWGYAAALDTGTVTVHIRRLREKIEADPARPRFLQTVWGVGYRFSP